MFNWFDANIKLHRKPYQTTSTEGKATSGPDASTAYTVKKIWTAIQLYPERTATSVHSWIPIHWKLIRFHPN